jgi:hypothetical protein
VRGGLAARLLALAEDVLEKGMGRYDPAIRAWGRARRAPGARASTRARRAREDGEDFGYGLISLSGARRGTYGKMV